MSATQEPAREPDRDPVFRVVRGVPTAEELAALVGAILVRSRPAAPVGGATTTGAWVRSARPGAILASGLPTRAGSDAWRISGLPR